MDQMIIANVALDIFCILLCLMPILYLTSAHRYKIKLNQYFMGLCISNALMILGDIGDWAIRDFISSGEKILLTALTLLYYISSALVLFFISSYVKEYLKLTKRQSKYFILTVAVLCIVQVILALLSPLTGSIFYINENGYQRGNLFLLSQVIPVLNMILCIICIFVNRKKLSGREKVFFHLYLLLPPVSMLVQTMFRGLGIVSPIITLNILILFINIQHEQELALHQREKELAELQIDILLSQIQPHFLYNALATISHLCRHDPEAARKATKEFSMFLRGNMDSLHNRNPIPFEQELTHVMNYLSLEQQRFHNRLRIVYDIQHNNFKIPPLTLQPLVENAVRHGILHRDEGGVITISTAEAPDAHIVTISDDGVGIEKAKTFANLGEHAHIGIENVRSRLQAMVHGTVEIKSSNEGTTVTMRIPKEGM